MTIKTSVTKGLTEEEAAVISSTFDASALLRERYIKLLEEKSKLSRDLSVNKDLYVSPSWAYLQADARGYERAILEFISLLS
jgi:hypothetical protein